MTSKPPAEPVQGALQLDTIQEGGIVVYRMTFPFLPPSKNQWDNWLPAWRNSCKKKWIKRVQEEVARQGIPLGKPKVGLSAQLVFAGMKLVTNQKSGLPGYSRSNPRRDPQNFAQTLWNFVPDALVRAGVVVDDNEGRIQIGENWGVQLLTDDRAAPRARVERTILTIAMVHPKPAQVVAP